MISSLLPLQVIQTLRPVDLDNFANGKFSFSLPADDAFNPNFTLKDNGGELQTRGYCQPTTCLKTATSGISNKTTDTHISKLAFT